MFVFLGQIVNKLVVCLSVCLSLLLLQPFDSLFMLFPALPFLIILQSASVNPSKLRFQSIYFLPFLNPPPCILRPSDLPLFLFPLCALWSAGGWQLHLHHSVSLSSSSPSPSLGVVLHNIQYPPVSASWYSPFSFSGFSSTSRCYSICPPFSFLPSLYPLL